MKSYQSYVTPMGSKSFKAIVKKGSFSFSTYCGGDSKAELKVNI